MSREHCFDCHEPFELLDEHMPLYHKTGLCPSCYLNALSYVLARNGVKLKILPSEGSLQSSISEEEIETAYWEFDAERNKQTMSERDCFKRIMRKMIRRIGEIINE